MTAPLATTRAHDNHVPDDVDARLTGLLESLVAQRGVHHANLALTSGDGKQRWSAASGPAGADGHPPRSDTPFFIASVTKRFIITLVLQAHERGELDLAAPINRYLPAELIAGLHVFRGIDRTSAITVRHLASHTSGLPDYFEKRREGPSLYERLAAGQDLAWTFEDAMRITREQQRPHFEPQDLTAARQKARYSDTGFQLLIRIVETVTDRSFAEHSGATGTWLFHCPELDLHLVGTVDQTKGQAIPFRFMARCLGVWRTSEVARHRATARR
ncbi:serine hydrolase domain-containing protein [Nonomuraea dietziae]|uniref:serine hydrolase domain-containing protein n=1 Tax=Nonomuraea dietziae TaxID=65515 RepID=UPI0033CCB50F